MLVRLSLQGLRCKACISAVRSTLEENGAVVIGISLREAEIEIDDGDAEKIEKILKDIKELGYEAKVVGIQR
ncbi:MAG: hypothetical protein QXD49_04635 [Archaeoglobaceae archaeon]|uniref:Heavy-metal-associated domain-containing protein n=1 Tax=Archaeoglobus fulgidus TaxID=2234 RepID=A0A7J3M4Y3_ARCFL